jgi:hypothetical protein
MGRTSASTIENNFSKGLITEAHGLNFPENAVTEGVNFVINRDGSISRRLGIDYEEGYDTVPVTRDDSAISEFVWENVGGDGELTFVVVQVGYVIYYYVLTADGVISDNRKSFFTSLADFDLAPARGEPCQFASGDGKLFVTHPFCNPFYVEYDADTDDITETVITIKIRDFEGVEDDLDVEERPATLEEDHEYNLYNQGWYIKDVTIDVDGSATDDPLDKFFDDLAVYPSNADIWWILKNSLDEFRPAMTSGMAALGNTPAPKGHFILDAFDTDRSNAHEDIGDVEETTAGNRRPKTCAFFSGRVWYAGVDKDKYNTNVYFTQIIEEDEQIEKCYQLNDPTSEEQFDLLPTDGGVVKVQEAGNIIKLFPMQDKLLIMATNGIWSIQGSEGIGFRANDFSVVKVSGVGLLSNLSVVNVEGLPFFWNNNGIYTIVPNEFGSLEIKSLTDKTIQTFYNEIPALNRKYSKGAYNGLTKVIKWVYRQSEPLGVDNRYNYDSVLCLDLNNGAFYVYNIETAIVDNALYPYLTGILAIQNSLTTEATEDQFYYLATMQEGVEGVDYNLTFARESDTSHRDWVSEPGVSSSYDTYFITGYKVHSQANRQFQANYMWVFSEYQENNSCFVQGIWDYANSGDSGRYTQRQECCGGRDYTDVQVKRLKMRGSGLVLQYKFMSNERDPFHIIGWSTFESSNERP